MELFVDIGNTMTNLKTSGDNHLYLSVLTKDINNQNKELISFIKSSSINVAVISSVAPMVYERFVEVIKSLVPDIEIFCLSHNHKIDFINSIDDPSELGADLICDLNGAANRYEGPLLIIDMGTASKILYLDENKKFTSCAIIPGLGILYKSLSNNTELIGKIDLADAKPLLECKNTESVVNSSIIYSHIDSINGLVRRFEKETNKKLLKIVTGGYSSHIKDEFDFEFIQNKELTLLGLEDIYRKNTL